MSRRNYPQTFIAEGKTHTQLHIRVNSRRLCTWQMCLLSLRGKLKEHCTYLSSLYIYIYIRQEFKGYEVLFWLFLCAETYGQTSTRCRRLVSEKAHTSPAQHNFLVFPG